MDIFRVTPPYRSGTRNIVICIIRSNHLEVPSAFLLRTIFFTSLNCPFVVVATSTNPSTLTAKCNEIQREN